MHDSSMSNPNPRYRHHRWHYKHHIIVVYVHSKLQEDPFITNIINIKQIYIKSKNKTESSSGPFWKLQKWYTLKIMVRKLRYKQAISTNVSRNNWSDYLRNSFMCPMHFKHFLILLKIIDCNDTDGEVNLRLVGMLSLKKKVLVGYLHYLKR